MISVIGDGSLTGGMAYEALNNAAEMKTNFIIVLNDNHMSISKNVGGMSSYLGELRTAQVYTDLKDTVENVLGSIPFGGEKMVRHIKRTKSSIKQLLVPGMFFEDMGIKYLGPVDGHDLKALRRAFTEAKRVKGPVLVHVLTKKGKGYLPAEDNTSRFHGTGPFDIQTGEPISKSGKDSCTDVFSKVMLDLAKKDDRLVAITAAMEDGTGRAAFHRYYPVRFFDVGIAEEHAVTFAAGLAAGGMNPVFAVYSSFLQRAYDQVNHDMARMNVGVVIGIDRCGLVGDDGETHQGVFDIAMLRSVPNLILSQPKDAKEAQNMIYTAFDSKKPFCIRYPRGNALYAKNKSYSLIPIGSWEKFVVGTPTQIVITYGPDVDHVINKARENKMGLLVVNARFFKPIDEVMMKDLLKMDLSITVYETDVKIGGLSSAIFEFINTLDEKIHIIGIEDHYVCHGSIRSLRNQEGISTECLFEELEKHG